MPSLSQAFSQSSRGLGHGLRESGLGGVGLTQRNQTGLSPLIGSMYAFQFPYCIYHTI